MANMSLTKKSHALSGPPTSATRTLRKWPWATRKSRLMDEAQRCLNCKNKPCVNGCPPLRYISPSSSPRWPRATLKRPIRVISATSALPAVCGRVCPQESQCEKYCVRGKKGEPVGIGRLERFVADWHNAHCTARTGKAGFQRPQGGGHRLRPRRPDLRRRPGPEGIRGHRV